MKYILSLSILISSIFCHAQIVTKELDTLYITDRKATYTYVVTDTFRKKYVPPVVVPPTPIPPSGSVVANLKFENPSNIFEGNGGLATSTETFGPKPIVVNEQGRSALKVTINSTAMDQDRLRNELTIWPHKTLKEHGGYEITFFIPQGFKVDNNSNNFIQFHNAGRSGMIPNVSFMLKSGFQLDLNIAWTLTANASIWSDKHFFFNVSDWVGRWVTLKLEANWFQDSSGYLKVWVDGKPLSNGTDFIGQYKGPMGYTGDVQGPYLKWGLMYPAKVLPAGATETSQNVLYDNITITK